MAQLRAHLDPEAVEAIAQLNASLNARIDRLSQAVEGPSPWLDLGRAPVQQVGGRPSRAARVLPQPGVNFLDTRRESEVSVRSGRYRLPPDARRGITHRQEAEGQPDAEEEGAAGPARERRLDRRRR